MLVPSMNRVAADDQDDRHPLHFSSAPYCRVIAMQRRAPGRLGDHALRGVGNCELNALDLVVEGVNPGLEHDLQFTSVELFPAV